MKSGQEDCLHQQALGDNSCTCKTEMIKALHSLLLWQFLRFPSEQLHGHVALCVQSCYLQRALAFKDVLSRTELSDWHCRFLARGHFESLYRAEQTNHCTVQPMLRLK